MMFDICNRGKVSWKAQFSIGMMSHMIQRQPSISLGPVSRNPSASPPMTQTHLPVIIPKFHNYGLTEEISTKTIACISLQGRIPFQRSTQLLVPPLPTSCVPLTNPDLSERIFPEPIACISLQGRIPFQKSTQLLVPPLPMSCVPLTNPDLSERISEKPIDCITLQRTNT
ncbi:hypothetical protein V1478_016253 [Vespula squamosa]|uniref:Uncharacterized protein n=1 Tax=Vespula squamosa TaxID=30214 RepID=A0ABD1ZZA8_VESSQ